MYTSLVVGATLVHRQLTTQHYVAVIFHCTETKYYTGPFIACFLIGSTISKCNTNFQKRVVSI